MTIDERKQKIKEELSTFDFAKIKSDIDRRRGFEESQRQKSEEAIKQIREILADVDSESVTIASEIAPNLRSALAIDFDKLQLDEEYAVEKQEELIACLNPIAEFLKEALDV